MYSPCYAICPRCDFHARLLEANHCPECRFVLVDKCPSCGQPIYEPHKDACTACGHRLRWLKGRTPPTMPQVQPVPAKPWEGWKSTGAMDIIPQVDEAHDWAVSQLLERGIVIPPGGGSERRQHTFREICMAAGAAAEYHLLTGDARNLAAAERGIAMFRKYREAAFQTAVPMPEIGPGHTVEFQVGGVHGGRNTMALRRAAQATGDTALLDELYDHWRWWFDHVEYDGERHAYPNAVMRDGQCAPNHVGSTVYNMQAGCAVSLWIVGHERDDREMMARAEDMVEQLILPAQLEDGYWDYSWKPAPELGTEPFRADNYSVLTTAFLTHLLEFDPWRRHRGLLLALKRAGEYCLHLMEPTGVVDGESNFGSINRGYDPEPKSNGMWAQTAKCALVLSRLALHFGEERYREGAERNLRWLYTNRPLLVPLMGPGKWYTYENAPRHTFEKSYWGYIFVAAQVIHIAFEGFHVVEDNGDIRLVPPGT